jgi:hypothetical protein
VKLAPAVCGRYGSELVADADVPTPSVIVRDVALPKKLACSSRLEDHVKPFKSDNSPPFGIERPGVRQHAGKTHKDRIRMTPATSRNLTRAGAALSE